VSGTSHLFVGRPFSARKERKNSLVQENRRCTASAIRLSAGGWPISHLKSMFSKAYKLETSSGETKLLPLAYTLQHKRESICSSRLIKLGHSGKPFDIAVFSGFAYAEISAIRARFVTL
jgi:hypothetical protein